MELTPLQLSQLEKEFLKTDTGMSSLDDNMYDRFEQWLENLTNQEVKELIK